MTAIRRTAVLLGLTASVVIGTGIPASATFSATSTAPIAKVGTVTVAPPAGVTLAGTWCEPASYETHDAATATTTTTHTVTLHATLVWQPSATRGVNAYRIGATANGRAMPLGDYPTTSTRITQSFEIYRGATAAQPGILSVKASVTALTTYGWLSKTQHSEAFSC